MSPIRMLARLVFLPSWTVAAAILLKGYQSVGDGFAAGSIAALGVIVWIVSHGRGLTRSALPVRTLIKLTPVGLLAMLATAAVPLVGGHDLLTHFPRNGGEAAGFGVLKLHTAFLFDTGMALATLGAITAVADALAAVAGREAA